MKFISKKSTNLTLFFNIASVMLYAFFTAHRVSYTLFIDCCRMFCQPCSNVFFQFFITVEGRTAEERFANVEVTGRDGTEHG